MLRTIGECCGGELLWREIFGKAFDVAERCEYLEAGALDKLANIDKAVQIASAVIVLGAAITTHDPSQIENAAKSVITTCGVSAS